MPSTIAPLCSERHYTASAAHGRYATDRSAGPDYVRVPDEETLGRWAACRFANHARYLREQDVVGLVMDCEDAYREQQALSVRLEHVHEAMVATDLTEEPELYGQLQDAALQLNALAEQALARRRRIAGTLRAVGISPQDQARIRAEIARRSARARTRAADSAAPAR